MIRYYALGLCGVSAALLLAVGWGAVQADARRLPPPPRDALELRPLTPADLANQERLAAGLQAIARLQSGEVLQGQGPAPALALPAPGTEVAGSVQMPRRSLSLYLESLADDRHIVSVDERLVQPGSRLSEGGRLARVQPYQVLITEAQGRQRLDLSVDRLSVGTLRWPDGTPASVATQAYRQGSPAPRTEAPR